MRVGLVLDESLDATDGVQQYVLALGEWLGSAGHEVYFLVGETKQRVAPNILSLSKNVRLKFNGNRLSIPLPVRRTQLMKTLSQLELDILHVQTPYSPFLAGRLISLVSPQTAVIGTFHILPYSGLSRFGSSMLGKINTKTAQRFDAMMAVTEPAQTFAGKYYGFRSVVVPNMVRVTDFMRSPLPRKSSRSTVVFLGRLVERKGCLQFLRALAYIKHHSLTTKAFQVKIGGKGPQLDRLQRFVEQHELTEDVEFVGFIPEREKPQFLGAADVIVLPSLGGESFGISVIEAFAASRGVVLAGNNLGYASIMKGFEDQLFDPTDIEYLAVLIVKYIEDIALCRSMAAKQRSHAKQFDTTVVGPEVLSIYKKALQKRSAS